MAILFFYSRYGKSVTHTPIHYDDCDGNLLNVVTNGIIGVLWIHSINMGELIS